LARSWIDQGDGPSLEWGGRSWLLDTGRTPVGLWAKSGEATVGPLLGVEGTLGPSGLKAWSVDGVQAVAGGVKVTGAIGPLRLTAVWEPSGEDGLDLGIVAELPADEPGPIVRFEVGVISVLPEAPGSRPRRWVEPRDAASASLSYDGREGDVSDLTTLPTPADGPLPPRVLPSPWDDGLSYVEMAGPGDLSRRITVARRINSLGHTTRHALFGLDLPPGGAATAGLRGVWMLSSAPAREAVDLAEAFARERLGS